MIEFEKFGFDEFEGDLSKAALTIQPELAKVTGKALLNIKRGAQRRAKAIGPHLRRLPYAIDYDVWTFGAQVVGEVGANHAKAQGRLAWVPEFGTPTSAPHPIFRPEVDKELPKWPEFAEKVAYDALGGGS